MRVKKFMARTLPEAMVQVKAELGSDAVILHTNEVKVGGIFGMFGSRMIQVMAAVEQRSAAAPAPAMVERQPLVPFPAPALVRGQPPGAGAGFDAVRSEVADVKALISEVVERLNLPASAGRLEPALQELMGRLARGGVEEQLALSLVNRVRTRMIRGEGTWPQEIGRAHV